MAVVIVTPGAVSAVLVGAALAGWQLYLTRRTSAPRERIGELERKLTESISSLDSCRRVNRWLRYRNELVAASLLRLLPEHDRLDLLANIGDRVPAPGEVPQLSDDDRRWLGDDLGEGGLF